MSSVEELAKRAASRFIAEYGFGTLTETDYTRGEPDDAINDILDEVLDETGRVWKMNEDDEYWDLRTDISDAMKQKIFEFAKSWDTEKLTFNLFD